MKRKLILSSILIFPFLLVLFPRGSPQAKVKKIPASKRSVLVIKRVLPGLETHLVKKDLAYGSEIFIRIFKESFELEMWVRQETKYKLFKTYPICYYSGALGPKVKQGDLQSPEGFYFVTPDKLKPSGSYHLSFFINYPNKYDKAHKRTGGEIMIHGSCVSVGCYAMTNPQIEEIFALADGAFRGGQKFFRVHIFPFRMTEENMEKYRFSPWTEFWKNLKEGYDYFETKKVPPNVVVKKSRYVFEDL